MSPLSLLPFLTGAIDSALLWRPSGPLVLHRRHFDQIRNPLVVVEILSNKQTKRGMFIWNRRVYARYLSLSRGKKREGEKRGGNYLMRYDSVGIIRGELKWGILITHSRVQTGEAKNKKMPFCKQAFNFYLKYKI